MDQKAREIIDGIVGARRDQSLTYLAGLAPDADLFSTVRGHGAIFFDEYGDAFLDFNAGSQMVIGHTHEQVHGMVLTQLSHHTYAGDYGLFGDRLVADHAEALSTRLGPDKAGNPRQVFYAPSSYDARMVAAQICLLPPSGGAYFLGLLDAEGAPREGGEVQDEVHTARAQNLKIVADEVHTGFGRTGTFCFYEQYGLDPDVILLGSSGTAGIPCSMVVAPRELFKGPAFGQLAPHIMATPSPLASAAGVAVMEKMTPELLAHASNMGAALQRELDSLCTQFENVLLPSVGVGLTRTIRLVNPLRAAEFRRYCRKAGLIIQSNLRMTPPLPVTEQQIGSAVDAIALACIEMEG